MDWPIDHKEMDIWYSRAENHMGTLGTGGRERLPGNNNYKVFEAGAKKLGYKNFHTGNMSINSKPYDGRVACQQIGFCFQGCKSGAKWKDRGARAVLSLRTLRYSASYWQQFWDKVTEWGVPVAA